MKYDNVRLTVLSRERGDWLLSHPNTSIAQISHLKPWLCVRTDDTTLDCYKELAKRLGLELHVYDSTGIFGYAQTVAMILAEAIKDKVQVMMAFDDDLSLMMHNPILGASPMFKLCTPYEIGILLQHAAELVCAELPALTFTPIMSRLQEQLVRYTTWLSMVTVFYVPHFDAHATHRLWKGKEIEAYCDVNFSLQLLTDGFLSGMMSTLLVKQNFNNPGGCSLYRTLEVQNASVEYLKKTYPGLVRTHIKHGFLDDLTIERESPIVSWQKAFDRDLFKGRFGISAANWALPHLKAYEAEYSKFIEELRK